MRVKINSTGEIKEVKQVGDKLFDKENNCYSLGQVTVLEEWHPASELPPENTEIVIWTEVHSPQFENAPVGYVPILGRLIDGKWPSNIIVKYWCYPPEEE